MSVIARRPRGRLRGGSLSNQFYTIIITIIILAEILEIEQGLGRFLRCGARKPEQTWKDLLIIVDSEPFLRWRNIIRSKNCNIIWFDFCHLSCKNFISINCNLWKSYLYIVKPSKSEQRNMSFVRSWVSV